MQMTVAQEETSRIVRCSGRSRQTTADGTVRRQVARQDESQEGPCLYVVRVRAEWTTGASIN